MQLSETELRIKKVALLQEFNKLSSLKNVKFPEAKIAFGKFSEIIISDEQKELEYKLI